MATLSQNTLNGIRKAAEGSLFYFCRAILNLYWFADLHRDMCAFLPAMDKRRKLLLIPRDHGKTTLVKALITHMLIQPQDNNIYFPNVSGTNVRIILAGETTKNASRHLRSIESTVEKNSLLSMLWPHIQPGNKWSEHEMELVRSTNYSEPTIEALGTDSAIASRHVDAIFEDDIFTFEAAMSPSVAERVRLWDKALEPILDETENSEAINIITGTPWSNLDIYKEKIDNTKASIAEQEEPEYEIYLRSAIENHEPIWPQRFSLSRLANIERRLRGTGFWQLNYMCDYTSSELIDLQPHWLQTFFLRDNEVTVG
jgi:hypothetical protein